MIDDLDAVALPRPRRGNQLQYESSVFSPPGGPVTPLRRGPKMVPGSDKSELREMLRSPRNPDETQFKRRKRVLASYDAMKQVVQKLDTSRTGAITARDLNNALDKLGIKMRHGDFKRLAADVDPSMQRDGGLTHLPALGRVLDEPARRRGEGRPSLAGAGGRRRATGRGGERMKAEASGGWRKMLEEKVSRHWKQLQRDFKRLDPQRSGLVDMHHLIPALEVYGINLQTEDADALYLQMGVGRTGEMETLVCGLRLHPLLRAMRIAALALDLTSRALLRWRWTSPPGLDLTSPVCRQDQLGGIPEVLFGRTVAAPRRDLGAARHDGEQAGTEGECKQRA